MALLKYPILILFVLVSLYYSMAQQPIQSASNGSFAPIKVSSTQQLKSQTEQHRNSLSSQVIMLELKPNSVIICDSIKLQKQE